MQKINYEKWMRRLDMFTGDKIILVGLLSIGCLFAVLYFGIWLPSSQQDQSIINEQTTLLNRLALAEQEDQQLKKLRANIMDFPDIADFLTKHFHSDSLQLEEMSFPPLTAGQQASKQQAVIQLTVTGKRDLIWQAADQVQRDSQWSFIVQEVDWKEDKASIRLMILLAGVE